MKLPTNDGVRTTCAYCGVGCGIVAMPEGGRIARIAGDPAHPSNAGRLCSKGTHLGETIGLEGRLLHPQIGDQRTDWETALHVVANALSETIAEHGPDSVAFYVSGQLLTEDYYVANKLMKGFIGSANIDTNSRLCMASAVAAHNRAFGEDVVPCSYEDLEEADLILLVGSNTAWCHPVIWQRIEAAREKRGTKLVVIDPRRTETAERADLHVQLAPDGDVALFNALLDEARQRGLVDEAYLAAHVETPAGFWNSLSRDPGIDPVTFDALADLIAAHPRIVTLFSQGANQSTSGTDKGNAIINLHLATGRIGEPGMGPFSITGQPNAMGGREVGGLASMLAVHMGFSDAERDRAQRFWNSPTICPGPGLKAVEMFDAVADGRIKAIWVMATNPAVSMPDAGLVRQALEACPLVIVSDCIADTDTSAYADIKLPALGWGEKDGTVTSSERMISRQRGFLEAPGDAKPDWWIMAEVAKRMGFANGFDFPSNAAVFREYAAQTGFENNGARVLDISHLADISDADYDSLAPFRWGAPSPFATGRFSTSNGKARMVAVSPPASRRDPAFPLMLNTGRYRDQWHTMTRTGLSPKLSMHRREPLLEVHPSDAATHGLADGALARVSTASGSSVFRVAVTDAQRPGDVFVPMHWTDQMSSSGRTGLLPSRDRDPFSGQPGFKNTPARIEPAPMAWHGFLIAHDLPDMSGIDYWTQVRTSTGLLVELAGTGPMSDALALLPEGPRAEAADERRGVARAAVLKDGMLEAALFLSRDGDLPSRDWLIVQLSELEPSTTELLAGRPAAPQADRGPIVCVCFDVGTNTIVEAIVNHTLMTVEEVGAALNAGTNCGSCRPAIAGILAAHIPADTVSAL